MFYLIFQLFFPVGWGRFLSSASHGGGESFPACSCTEKAGIKELFRRCWNVPNPRERPEGSEESPGRVSFGCLHWWWWAGFHILGLLQDFWDVGEAGRNPSVVCVFLVYLNIRIVPHRLPEPRVWRLWMVEENFKALSWFTCFPLG